MSKNFPLCGGRSPQESSDSDQDLPGSVQILRHIVHFLQGHSKARTFFACRSLRTGYTFPEIAIVLGILAILASIAVYSAQDSITEYRMMKSARLFQSDVQLLRSLAINTNRQTRLKLVAADVDMVPGDAQVGEWLLQVGNRSSRSNEWDTLPIDRDGSSSSDEGERSLSVGGNDEAPWISLAPWQTLVGPGLDNTDCIVFSPRGWLENPPGDFVNGYIDLTIVNKRALALGGPEKVLLRVSRGGLARMELGEHSALPDNAVGAVEASAPGAP